MKTIYTRTGAVVFRNERVLLVPHYKNGELTNWYLPGGGIEFLESIEEATFREFREETGFDIELLKLIEVAQNIRPEEPWHSITFMYLARIVSGTLKTENNDFGQHTPCWFSRENLPNIVDYLYPGIIKAFDFNKQDQVL